MPIAWGMFITGNPRVGTKNHPQIMLNTHPFSIAVTAVSPNKTVITPKNATIATDKSFIYIPPVNWNFSSRWQYYILF